MADAVVQIADNPSGTEFIDNEVVANTAAPGGVNARRQRVVALGPAGVLLAAAVKQDPLVKYKIADEDAAGVTQFYGFTTEVNAATNWIILQVVKGATNTYRYANQSNNGGAAYAASWTGRATLAYGLLYTLTGV